MKPKAAQLALLHAMSQSHTLKSHRDVEGNKTFQLHAPDGGVKIVEWAVVEFLQDHHLIDSNKKFPAATYWVTEAGKRWVRG